jgi:transposase-like protein
MARGKAHSDEIRAAVLAALLAGQSVTEVARSYNLDTGLVSRWRKSIPADHLQKVADEKRESLASLVEDHLRASLTAAAKVATKAHDESWLTRQSAESLAVFYGVLTDKAIRILEAAQRAEAASEN